MKKIEVVIGPFLFLSKNTFCIMLSKTRVSTVFSVSVSGWRVSLMVVVTPLAYYEKPFRNSGPFALVVPLVAIPIYPPFFFSIDHVTVVLRVH
jgi:hypothetical protein